MGTWYMSRKEIEENSPSRKDGIDLKKETSLRKSYCTFLKDLGIRLKMPQITIATAVLFCQRFFLRQSHAKNDHRIIATVCMFLASKVKESRCHLRDIIFVSNEMIHEKDPAAAQKIKQKEVYEQQKELILLGERVVLATLGFDFDVQEPYGPLIAAIKKFNVANNALAQVAWNFLNDGLKICNQLLEFYEEIGIPLSQGSEAEVAVGGRTKSPASDEQAWKQIPSHPVPQHSSAENSAIQYRGTKNQSTGGSKEMGSDITDRKMDLKTKDSQNSKKLPHIVSRDRDRMVGGNLDLRESPLGYSPKEAVKMIDKDKSKVALEKSRNERGEIIIKKDVMDEDDHIEMKLEDGVELALENEKNKRERRQNWPKTDDEDERQMSMKGQLQKDMNEYIAEEGEVIDMMMLHHC
ncbi:putative cyclin [Medicago truncatula]|uniref:B-like cyclin n=1 Tax=Medicago truncatula TaxID=3880 RepID=A0A396H5J0_MEDTR|nr:putative cyclin [Medicago truncatula]